MAIKKKYSLDYEKFSLRDPRPMRVKLAEKLRKPEQTFLIFGAPIAILMLSFVERGFYQIAQFIEIIVAFLVLYAIWHGKRKIELPFKLPLSAKGLPDPNNPPPGKKGPGKAEGILYLGNDSESGEELWVTNSDARTHILYLGTTGAGKTEGLKSLVTNALTWGSGFVYVDGKADTDLWGAIYSLARRFGRDDDLLVLNYMTGNSDLGAASNTLNPFSSGSASYLSNLLVSLMDDAGDDNAMWKGRAVAMLGSLMPALTWKRDNQGLLLEVGTIRDFLTMEAIIRLSRDPALPEKIITSLQSYLDTLPGYVDEAFDDEGKEVPMPPDAPYVDLSVCRQQHGYLSMQFTRSLQSLADEYGYIFHTQLADIDLVDVVLNRRILVTLIPALEKSSDEAANLGKIVAASIKGMMGSTLGADVEGDWGEIIDNKQTRANSPFMTIFDEVGYYTAQGMAVMAAQARSLGFSLVFAAQDLPALEKRVKEEARSITGNCNIKIFGKLEDPTDTRNFFEKVVGEIMVAESQGYKKEELLFTKAYMDQKQLGLQFRSRASYDALKAQKEGEAHILFADLISGAKMFYAVAKSVRALRVQKLIGVGETSTTTGARDRALKEVSRRLQDADWTAESISAPVPTSTEISSLMFGFAAGKSANKPLVQCGALAVAGIAQLLNEEEEEDFLEALPQETATAAKATDSVADPVKTENSGQAQTIDEILKEKSANWDESSEEPVETPNQPLPNEPQGMAARSNIEYNSDGTLVDLPESVKAILQETAKEMTEGLTANRS